MHGFSKRYLSKLPKWKDHWWKFDRHGNPLPKETRKPWWEMDYYVQNPKAAKVRRKWEKLSNSRKSRKK